MLKRIPHIISPELMAALMKMGHSDTITLADANFPADSHTGNCIFCPGVKIPELLNAILPYFPLDHFISYPVTLMRNLDMEPVPEIWDVYEEIITKHDEEKAFQGFEYMDRLPFYKKSEESAIVVQTGSEERYANIILQKGVVPLE